MREARYASLISWIPHCGSEQYRLTLLAVDTFLPRHTYTEGLAQAELWPLPFAGSKFIYDYSSDKVFRILCLSLSQSQSVVMNKQFSTPPILDSKTLDSAQEGVERLWWSCYLVWRPSSQEIPGSVSVLSWPPPNYRLLLAITVIKHSFYWLPQWLDQFPILCSLPVGPGKTLFC